MLKWSFADIAQKIIQLVKVNFLLFYYFSILDYKFYIKNKMISKIIFVNLAWKNKDLFSVLKIIKKNGFDGIDCAPLQFSTKWNGVEKKQKNIRLY